jgi:hypothetical protein
MDSDDLQGEKLRRHFRLEYPPAQAPAISVLGHRFYVIDLSENGVRFFNPLRVKMPEDLFVAMIQLHEGSPIKVVGRVVRVIDKETCLELIKGVPYKTMLDEQVYLMNLRGKLKRTSPSDRN